MKALADRFDHIVLTVADIDATVDFYERVLFRERRVPRIGRRAALRAPLWQQQDQSANPGHQNGQQSPGTDTWLGGFLHGGGRAARSGRGAFAH